MVNYYSEEQAKIIFGKDFEDKYPSIHKSGSLRGMAKIYGWDLSKVIQVGNYYYHLRGHPKFYESNNKVSRGSGWYGESRRHSIAARKGRR